MTKWNFRRLYTEVLCSHAKFINWCKLNELLPLAATCPEGHTMRLKENISIVRGRRLGYFVCRRPHINGKGRITIAWTKNTFLQNSRAPPEQLLIITYCFTCHDLIQADACHEASTQIRNICKQTIGDWYCYCRELITDYMLKRREYNAKLGGQGVIVEVEDWRFGKRKYVGDFPEEMCALGMVETNSKSFCAVVSPNNDPETFFQILEKHIEPNTTVVMKDAEHYRSLSDNYTFIDPMAEESEQDEASEISDCSEFALPNPQTFKLFAGIHCDSSYGDYILEYLWRREMKMGDEDAFENFIHIIRCAYPV